METLRPLQFILKSLQEIYHDSERKFALGNESLLAHRKWASSSDLVSDQDKNNITLTPVSQIRIMKSPNKRKTKPSNDTSSETNFVYNGSTPSTAPEQLSVSRYDKSVLSPISDTDPSDTPRKRVTNEDDLQSSLRRRSYRRAIASEDTGNVLPGAVDRDRSSSERRSVTKKSDSRCRSRSEGPLIISSVDGESAGDARVIYQGEVSNSTSSLRESDSPRQKQLRTAADSRHQCLPRRSLPVTTSPVITDRSRTSSPETAAPPRPTTPKPPPPLSSVDSSRSSPRSSSSSTKFLNPAMGHVIRSPSRTSSSSSGSEESWHSVASSFEGGKRRMRRMPRTPSPVDRILGPGWVWEKRKNLPSRELVEFFFNNQGNIIALFSYYCRQTFVTNVIIIASRILGMGKYMLITLLALLEIMQD